MNYAIKFTTPFLIVLFAFINLATTTPSKIDSLIQLFGKSSKSVLVDTLVISAITSIEKIDYESGMQYVKEAFELGTKHQLDEPTHRALITYARLGVLTNETDQPYEELQLALARRKKEGNGEKQYSILNAIALIHEQKKGLWSNGKNVIRGQRIVGIHSHN